MTIETRPQAPDLQVDTAVTPLPALEEPAEPARGVEPATAPGTTRRTALARAVVEILARLVPDDAGLTVTLDGDPVSDQRSPGEARRAHVRVHGPDAVSRVALVPSETSLADGYLRGDLDIDGDVALAVEAARRLDPRRLTPADARRLLRYGLELRRGRGPAPEIRRLANLQGQPHSRARDMAAIRFHYDVGEPFYRLWLDRRLTYSCGYFDRDTDPVGDLDAAQEAKLDLVCRKLGLRPGQRLLDIGCGWGSLILHAAERYKVEAFGVTLSERQATEANRRAAVMGLEHRVRADLRDDRDLAGLGAFDAVASIGMFEHVGAANLLSYFEAAREALVPGGRFLNHGIATNRPAPRTAGLRANERIRGPLRVPGWRALRRWSVRSRSPATGRGSSCSTSACCARTTPSRCRRGSRGSRRTGRRPSRPRARRSPEPGASTCRRRGSDSSRVTSMLPSFCWQSQRVSVFRHRGAPALVVVARDVIGVRPGSDRPASGRASRSAGSRGHAARAGPACSPGSPTAPGRRHRRGRRRRMPPRSGRSWRGDNRSCSGASARRCIWRRATAPAGPTPGTG